MDDAASGGSGSGGSGAGGSGTGGSGNSGLTRVVIEEGELGYCSVDGVVEATNAGFSGTGYSNTDNALGAGVEWALNIGEAGIYALEFVYSSASEERAAEIVVNGRPVATELFFPPTVDWATWATVVTDVSLEAGENHLVLRATSASGLANLDRLSVTGAAVSASECESMVDPVETCAMNELSSCSVEADEIACHFGGEPGDYRVKVELGGDVAGDTYIDAEMHRRMLGRVVTRAGETRRLSFVTNVRMYEGQPLDPDQKGSSTGTPGLDVYIRGARPEVVSICRERVEPTPRIWIAGDSTVCDQSSTDYSGWGQHLPQFFDDPVSVANYADSGESSASFLSSAKLWKAIVDKWESGDWVFIQLGHNDKNVTAATFRANLKRMITDAEAAGVRPVLITPISRAGTALESQHVSSTGANLPQIIRDLGVEEGVPVLDLTVATSRWLATIDWKEYFALGTDRTHPNPAGAEAIAGLVAKAIREQGFELADLLR